MNETVNDIDEDKQSSGAQGPGHRLRTLRESEDLKLSRVSVLLHLSEEKLIALEADDYGKLPGPVFVQGYLRNYARLLGVPVEPILNAYHAASPESSQMPELKITQVSHEVGSGHALVRLATWGIVIGLILLVVVWWRGILQWPMSVPGTLGLGGESASPAEAEESDSDETDADLTFPVVEVDEDGVATLALPQARPEQPADALESAVEQEPVPTVESIESGRTEAESTAADNAGSIEEPRAASPDVVEQVVIEYSGTSWTKIEDASGTFKLEGPIKAGTRQVLRGTPPYRLVLGNASAVKIFVNGSEFDITPYNRGNVARFRLDPESQSQ